MTNTHPFEVEAELVYDPVTDTFYNVHEAGDVDQDGPDEILYPAWTEEAR